MPIMTSNDSIIVNTSVDDAFALMANITRHPEIFDNELVGYHGGPPQVGDSWETAIHFMGREIKTTWTLLEIAPPARIVFEGTSNSANTRIAWEFEAVNGGTQISYVSEGEPRGFFASVAAPLLRGNFEKLLRDSMERMQAQLEA